MAIKKNILITGGAGFIGFALAKHLSEKSYNIIIFDNLSRGKFDNEFKNLLKKKNVSFGGKMASLPPVDRAKLWDGCLWPTPL